MTSRDKILRAAQRIHDKEGLDGLSIRRVSARVGLTPMAIYRHFADKDALLDALVADGFAEFEAYVYRAAAQETPEARVRAMFREYTTFALDKPRLFELMFLIPRRNIPEPQDSLRTSPSPAVNQIIAALNEAMESGAIARDDPAQVLLFAWGTIHGLIALHFSGRFAFDDSVFTRIADAQIDRLMRLLAGSSTPTQR